MFYKLENNQVIEFPNGPTVFGAAHGIIPSIQEIELYAGWYWFDTLEEANTYFTPNE